MTKYGYARVSTKDQVIEAQVDALVAAGVDRANIFMDVGVSGKRAQRPGLDAMLAKLTSGDEVVVTKLDRLGRSMIHTAQLAEGFRRDDIGFVSLSDNVDTSTAQGRLMFNLLASFAEYERELIVERTMAGLAHARANGRMGGRRPVMTRGLALRVKALVDDGMAPAQIGKELKVSRATAYRYVATYEEALTG